MVKQAKEKGKEVEINNHEPQCETAFRAFTFLDENTRSRYCLAARSGIKTIAGLEPRLLNGEGKLYLEIAADSSGVGGDVRDIVCIRGDDYDGRWEIGLSCKHNHEALKHPRITEGMDFGADWMGASCSKAFFSKMESIMQPLTKNTGKEVLWSQIHDKSESFYIPILEAYLEEIRLICNENPNASKKLLEYFFGNHDFYKVIMDESRKATRVEGFNMFGTLNKSYKQLKPIVNVSKVVYPTRLIAAERKQEKGVLSATTIILTCDGGWAVSMRLHNKDSRAKLTSLAWDVQLVGHPPRIYSNTRGWCE